MSIDPIEAIETDVDAIRYVEDRYGMQHGISLRQLDNGTILEYVQRGDTYDTTLCRIDGGRWFESCWGEEAERAEHEHQETTGETRCIVCSELDQCIAYTGKSWHGQTCPSCIKSHA